MTHPTLSGWKLRWQCSGVCLFIVMCNPADVPYGPSLVSVTRIEAESHGSDSHCGAIPCRHRTLSSDQRPVPATSQLACGFKGRGTHPFQAARAIQEPKFVGNGGRVG